VAGEGPYANEDFPQGVVTEDIFKLFLWSANNGPWLMRTLFKIQRIMFLTDPVGVFEDTSGFDMSVKDIQFFTQDFRREIGAEMVEAFRRGVDGMTRDFVIERIDWPFELEEIHSPKVLVFHGDEDTMVHPKIGVYVSKHIPSCDEITIFPGEGHSIMYYRYEDIIRAMLEAWE
jgi:pimeloyl-ACP methyl ester carboxylesterase